MRLFELADDAFGGGYGRAAVGSWIDVAAVVQNDVRGHPLLLIHFNLCN